jgi:hypothetical protein
MRLQFRILTLLFLCASAVSGQDRASQEKVRAVMIPRQVGLVTLAFQPDCALHFENVKFLAGVNARFALIADEDVRAPSKTLPLGL